MNIEKHLNKEEEIELIIDKKKSFPFVVEDFFKLFLLFFSVFIINQISYDLERFHIEVGLIDIVPISFISIIWIVIIVNFHRRYTIAYKWKYIITNQRLIIINNKNSIKHSFVFKAFPNLTFEENAYGNGFIIIGEKEPVFMDYQIRINLSENDIKLYNIKNVKSIYNILKQKIENNTI